MSKSQFHSPLCARKWQKMNRRTSPTCSTWCKKKTHITVRAWGGGGKCEGGVSLFNTRETTLEIDDKGRRLRKLDIVYVFFSTCSWLVNEFKVAVHLNNVFFSTIYVFFVAENCRISRHEVYKMQPLYFKWKNHNSLTVYKGFWATNRNYKPSRVTYLSTLEKCFTNITYLQNRK